MLRYFGSYGSCEELTAILAAPTGTVRGRLAEAKLKLTDAVLASASVAGGATRKHAEELALL
jgi:hypothetical protein